jgi:F-type H+-transporting ATPase subunit delta
MAEAHEQFADVSAQRLAAIYAEALYNAAGKELPGVLEELDSLIDDVIMQNQRLASLFAGAAVGRKSRAEAIGKAFASRASKIFYQFLLVLNNHDRLDMIRPIRRALHQLSDERARRLQVHVYSAVALSDDFLERIRTGVHERFQLEPVLVLHVDPAHLGGLKIRIGDTVLDATVRTKLENIRNNLIARRSHEIQSRRDSFSSAD